MGLRLRKVVGYGVDNLTSMHGNIVDDRFDRKQFLERCRVLEETTRHQFSIWLRCNKTRIDQVFRSERPEVPDDAYPEVVKNASRIEFVDDSDDEKVGTRVHFNLTSGDQKVIVFQPVHTEERWTRNNDVLDFVEYDVATHAQGLPPMVHKVRLAGVPPHEGQLIRFRPGDTRVPEGVRALKKIDAPEAEFLVRSTQDLTTRSLIENDLIFNWRPPLPYDLVAGLVFLEPGVRDVFTLASDLRPMLYTFWT